VRRRWRRRQLVSATATGNGGDDADDPALIFQFFDPTTRVATATWLPAPVIGAAVPALIILKQNAGKSFAFGR
jgi:hypothetical protein